MPFSVHQTFIRLQGPLDSCRALQNVLANHFRIGAFQVWAAASGGPYLHAVEGAVLCQRLSRLRADHRWVLLRLPEPPDRRC